MFSFEQLRFRDVRPPPQSREQLLQSLQGRKYGGSSMNYFMNVNKTDQLSTYTRTFYQGEDG